MKGVDSLSCSSLLLGLLLLVMGCATLQTDDDDRVISGDAEIVVYGLSCPLCASNLDEQIKRVDGVTAADIDLDTGHVAITVAPDAHVTVSALRRAVADAGFTLQAVRERSAAE